MDRPWAAVVAIIVVLVILIAVALLRGGRLSAADGSGGRRTDIFLAAAAAVGAGGVVWASISPTGEHAAPTGGHAAPTGGSETPSVDGPELVPFRGVLLTPEEAAVVEVEGPVRRAHPPRTLAELSAELPYREGALQKFSRSLHLGQRKLLLTEIDFLTEFYGGDYTVVYVGAGPGIHIPFLASLFPSFRFELHDPTPFRLRHSRYYRDPGVRSRITTREAYFTDADARALAGRPNILFLSDIRTGADSEAARLAVPENMTDQQRWYELAAPVAGYLKFRLPWADGSTEYLEGEVRLQPWAPIHSTETRLLVRGPAKRVSHDNRDYERRMYYEYAVVRQWLSFEGPHFQGKVPGLDMCFDCQLEVRIWDRYLQARHDHQDRRRGRGKSRRATSASARSAQIAEFMNEASRELNQGLVARPHGVRPRELLYDSREDLFRECQEGRGPCVPNADRYGRREERHARMRKKVMDSAPN